MRWHAAHLPTTKAAGSSTQARREKEEDTGMAETVLDENTIKLGADRGAAARRQTAGRGDT